MSINKYSISEQAIKGLNDIWIYTFQKWSKEQADRYYDLIIGELEFIAGNFMIGKSAQQTRKNYRYSKIKSDLTFYKKAENGFVEIIRILHQRMDLENRLAE
ncbi:MAG: type II toxin-antitoxin system RelE/ParE family toxin [Psychroserpens sp.]|uniref:type II toxin-antitoxin system RelE/ParE family toxin n=1 Tax=Psychroserpens sp. TaxID=2020870 RepID=UPI003C715699